MKILYSKSTGGFYLNSVHGKLIPNDVIEINFNDYQELLRSQSSFKSISSDESGYPVLVDVVEVVKTPKQVTRAQGKAALIHAGLWQGVVDFVNSIEDATEKAVAEVALNDTTHWQRSSPFLNASAQALGLTDEQLDQLFIDASKIEL